MGNLGCGAGICSEDYPAWDISCDSKSLWTKDQKIGSGLAAVEGHLEKARWVSQFNRKDLQGQLCQVVFS